MGGRLIAACVIAVGACADTVLRSAGLDGVTYLHFLRLLRWLFLAITLFAALPLTIATYYLNTSTEYGSRTTTSTSNSTQQAGDSTAQDGQIMGQAVIDDMLVFTAANVVGNGLWVHIGFEWVVTGLVIFFGACAQTMVAG